MAHIHTLAGKPQESPVREGMWDADVFNQAVVALGQDWNVLVQLFWKLSHKLSKLCLVQRGFCELYWLLFLYIADLKHNKSTDRHIFYKIAFLPTDTCKHLMVFLQFHQNVFMCNKIALRSNLEKNKASGGCMWRLYVQNGIAPEHAGFINFHLKRKTLFTLPL